ncbi:MAG TPA: alpha/beta hydrolase family protein [Chloroflexota bacterium]|nr:alpha/beta hydrolase family protein [Chloroflexota bacterium]
MTQPSAVMKQMHRLALPDGHLVIAEAGDGPPLLLLHGWRADHRAWDRLLPYLVPTHRCIALDFRGGMGQSSTPSGGGEGTWESTVEDVATAVRWSGALRPLLVGASWGAKIALVYAARGAPCAGILCVDGAAFGTGGSLQEDVYAQIRCPVRMVFATRSALDDPRWAYTPETIATFATRHPHLEISWLPCGHDVANERPRELADLILAFSAVVRPA